MQTQLACWNCGFSNSPGSRFCANCGKPQKQQTCPECGAEIVQGAKFCANCGISLAAAETPVEAAAASEMPQLAQNFAPWTISAPHSGHVCCFCGFPQLTQKRDPTGLLNPQFQQASWVCIKVGPHFDGADQFS